jgi:hypothetical protein
MAGCFEMYFAGNITQLLVFSIYLKYEGYMLKLKLIFVAIMITFFCDQHALGL